MTNIQYPAHWLALHWHNIKKIRKSSFTCFCYGRQIRVISTISVEQYACALFIADVAIELRESKGSVQSVSQIDPSCMTSVVICVGHH